MTKIVVGLDPDSKEHGVALYIDGKLNALENLQLMIVLELVERLISNYGIENILFSIEDVCANNFVYARNASNNKKIMAKIGLSIGRCQQSQVEVMRMLELMKVKYVLHKPQKGNWAENRNIFKLITGWEKRSNDDQRSAAFFGYLALK